MLLKNVSLIALGVLLGGSLVMRDQSSPATQNPTIRDFPDLRAGMMATPGCIDVRFGTLNNGKTSVVYGWFKNKAAVDAWYNSEMHREVMKKYFPTMTGKPHALMHYTDEKSPLLVVASITPSNSPQVAGTNLMISQIAIEIFTPVPGGVAFNGAFSPDKLEVPHLVRIGKSGS